MKRQSDEQMGSQSVGRRQILRGALLGSAAAVVGGVIPGFGRHKSLLAAAPVVSEAWIDFDFPDGGMKLRRVIVSQRAVGKVTARNGRRFGLMPTVNEAARDVAIAVFDLSHKVSDSVCTPKLLKTLKLSVGEALTAVNLPDDQGFRLKVSRVTKREIRPDEFPTLPIVEGQAFDCSIDCCVHCPDDPEGHDTCGSAVCCDIPCGPPCGMCVDPGGNTHVCDGEGGF